MTTSRQLVVTNRIDSSLAATATSKMSGIHESNLHKNEARQWGAPPTPHLAYPATKRNETGSLRRIPMPLVVNPHALLA